MSAASFRACQRCGFYVAANQQQGSCRRRPPQMLVTVAQDALGRMQQQVMADFPVVKADSWCGEFDLLAPTAAKAN